MNGSREPILAIRGLRTEYPVRLGLFRRASAIRILDDFDLKIYPRETLGLVGESGSGKTTVIQSILRLVRAAAGEILLDGVDLTRAEGGRLRRLRREVQVVFQNPFSSLDPHVNVLGQVSEPLRVHRVGNKGERQATVIQLLHEVGLSSEYLSRYPHELSGGQAQRVALARALALRPKLLLLDEPTSSLDVSVQAQVLNLLLDLQQKLGVAYLFVSHDLGVVQHLSDRIAVMYLGEIVEMGPTETIFRSPGHPYTRALLTASGRSIDQAPVVLTGNVPKFSSPPAGCRFHTRCPFVMEVCRAEVPPAFQVGDGQWARCHLLAPQRTSVQPYQDVTDPEIDGRSVDELTEVP